MVSAGSATASITYIPVGSGGPPPPPTEIRYSCVGGVCQVNDDGEFGSLDACIAATCSAPPPPGTDEVLLAGQLRGASDLTLDLSNDPPTGLRVDTTWFGL